MKMKDIIRSLCVMGAAATFGRCGDVFDLDGGTNQRDWDDPSGAVRLSGEYYVNGGK